MKLHVIASLAALLVGCSAGGTDKGGVNPGSGNTGSGSGATVGSGAQPALGVGGNLSLGGGAGTTPPNDNPVSCEEAAQDHTYVGCDFWPTITANLTFPPAR